MLKKIRTHSCEGTKPFLPTPAAATRSRLPLSDDCERLSFIFPRAFSDIDDAETASDVGVTPGSVVDSAASTDSGAPSGVSELSARPV